MRRGIGKKEEAKVTYGAKNEKKTASAPSQRSL